MNEKRTVKFNSVLEMVGFLKTNNTGCRFVSILSETEPKLKKSCPFKGVKKIARRIGWLNMNYNKAVRSRIAALLNVELPDVEYVNGETWYEHVMQDGKALPLCVNKKTPESGKYYMQYFPQRSDATTYVDSEGNTIDERALEPHFYAKGEHKEWKPFVITLALENIKELRASGLIIETAPNVEELETLLANDN